MTGPHGKVDFSKNNELRKLQFFGAGPKMAVPSAQMKAKQGNMQIDSRLYTFVHSVIILWLATVIDPILDLDSLGCVLRS